MEKNIKLLSTANLIKILALLFIAWLAFSIAGSNFLFFRDIFALILGVVIFAISIVFMHLRLSSKGKSGWWLLIFFGPLVVATTLVSALPADRDELIMVYIIVAGILALPTAIWGVVELITPDRKK